MKDEMISTAEAADILGITQVSVQRLLKKGTLAGQRVGRIWVVYRSSAEDYLKQFGELPKTSPKRGQTEE